MKHKGLLFLLQTRAPIWLCAIWSWQEFRNRNTRRKSARARGAHFTTRDAFRATSATLKLDSDWFTGKIPSWLLAFDRVGFAATSPLRCLEIGSWQGLSAYFTLWHFKQAHLTCVDTWQGSDEHKDGTFATADVLSTIEQDFDANLAPFADRLTKYRGTSLSYFAATPAEERFDLIYVDGSHDCADVLTDAVHSFQRLRVGGLVIFDDYMWDYYDDPLDNPAAAINAFVRLYARKLRVIGAGRQLLCVKTAD